MIAVIIVTYKNYQETIDCIRSVLNSEYNNIKIFLIDNGSFLLDKFEGIKDDRLLLFGTDRNIGYVGGVNYALRKATELRPDYYLIMNNDTIIDKMAIGSLVRTSESHSNKCITSGKIYNMDEPKTLQYIGQRCKNHNKLDYPSLIKNQRELDVGQYDIEMEMDMLDDIFWLIPRQVFLEVGYYSNYFFLYGEQNDYAMRTKKAGFKLVYTPLAKLWHYVHLTTGEGKRYSLRVIYWQFYSTLVLSYLHLSKYYFLVFYIRNFLKSLSKSFLSKKNSRAIAKLRLRAFFYFTKWLFNQKENLGHNPYS